MRTIKGYTAAMALGWLMPGLASARHDSEPRGPQENKPPTTTVAPQEHDTTSSRLGPMPGFDSEQAYVEATTTRVAELLDRASRESDELAAATLRLAAANIMLAEQLDARCSMRFLTTLGLPNHADAHDAASVLVKAHDLLDQVGRLIDKKMEQVANMGGETVESWAALKSNQTSLTAFHSALHVFLLPQEHDDVARAMRRAASGLAPLLERTEPDIVAAAALWYATLRAGEESKKPALSVLSPVLKGRPAAGINFAFYARLLRCRLIADRSSPPTALALLLQLEDMLDEWFDDDDTRNQATQSLLLLRAHILQGWQQRLPSDAQTDERQFLDQRIDGIHAELKKAGAAYLRLGHAIPLLAPAPR